MNKTGIAAGVVIAFVLVSVIQIGIKGGNPTITLIAAAIAAVVVGVLLALRPPKK